MELLPFERARITEIAYFYTYCDRYIWIAKRLGIVAPPSIEMYQGTLMHEVIAFAERKLHIFAKEDTFNGGIDAFQKLRNYFYDHIQELLISEKRNNINAAYEHFNEIQIELAISEVLDEMSYAYFNRYTNCIKLKSFSIGSRSIIREKKLSMKYKYNNKEIFIGGTPDFRDNFEKKDVVLLDYKRSKNPKITDYMRIQANGYAFLIKQCLGLDVVNTIFKFPLFDVQRFCSVEDFEPYLDGFINDLSQDKPPYYFESKNCCKWCHSECKKKCLELR